ncbi:subtilisin family serine protease [Limimaricola variabilis]|uniref:Subtilisin family serine protease n=1 Tax=Limimaricola variabilis TaxID=1492771 RepID=A0ABR6HRX5_9RHOB|nr:S8 family peptidase [Limimaricola variabilis]MBB3713299.1 subtilisin family serine protease [Limimaricola variabilis]
MENKIVPVLLTSALPRALSLAGVFSLAWGSGPAAQPSAQTTRYASPYQAEVLRYAPASQSPASSPAADNMGMLLLGLGLAVGAVAGLAGGGSSGSVGTVTPSDPPPPTRPAPPPSTPPDSSSPPVTSPQPETPFPPAGGQPFESHPIDQTPWQRSPEFERNYGLDLINAEHRYADGASGHGTLVAIFDTGAKLDHPDLAPRIDHARSWNYFTNTQGVNDIDGHGTHVASIVAGARNGRGAHGVAFEADLMILKGLPDAGTKTTPDARAIFADAQLRASAAGAAAINHSWSFVDSQGHSLTIDQFPTAPDLQRFYGTDLLAALDRSAGDGLVSVFATANDGYNQPSVTAGAAIHMSEAVRRHTLAVTAIDEAGAITNWANRCGQARDFCLAAPGDRIEAAGIRSETAIYSGTSMAAPHVAGAVALLKSNFPELTGGEITTILLETARDAGAPGPDNVYGRGILDLQNAVAPQGQIRIPAGDTIHDPAHELSQSGIASGGALGRALKGATQNRAIMVSDVYDRGYGMRLSGLVEADGAAALNTRGLRAFTQKPINGPIAVSGSRELHIGGAEGWADGDALTMPYASLLDATRLSYTDRIGDYELSISSTGAEKGVAFATASLGFEAAGGGVRLELGSLRERGALLGAEVSGAMGEDIMTRTHFASLGLDLALSAETELVLNGAWGRSSFASDGILQSGEDITTTSLAVGLATTDFMAPGDRVTIGLSRNLSIGGGKIGLDMPVTMAASTGTVRSEAILRETSYVEMEDTLAPTDLQIGYSRAIGSGRLAGGAIWRLNEGDGAAALSVGYTLRF